MTVSSPLVRRHSKLFAPHRNGFPLPTAEDRITCGDGWLVIVDALCAALQYETDMHGAPQIVVGKIKSKLGSLRFQAAGPRSERQAGMILMAQELSLRIPEDPSPPETLEPANVSQDA